MNRRSDIPRATVLLPVFNGLPFLEEAIGSLLGQTFGDFELLVIDDGSDDGSSEYLAALSDDRVRLLRSDRNQGLTRSLNRGLSEARGEYIVRMDADDISLPLRLERLVSFMDENRSVGVCGSWLEAFSDDETILWEAPLEHDEIVARLPFVSTLYHPTVIMRKHLFQDHDLRYDEDFDRAQDFDLWSRCAIHCRLANLDEVLLRYRLHTKSIGSLDSAGQSDAADRVRHRWLVALGLEPTEAETLLHRRLSRGDIDPNVDFLEAAEEWLRKLFVANSISRTLPDRTFARELSYRWFLACTRATQAGPGVISRYVNSALAKDYPGRVTDIAAMAMKCLLRQPGK